MPTTYTKESKPSTSYTKEARPFYNDLLLINTGSYLLINSSGDRLIVKSTIGTSYTKEAKP
jgi:hypothetical protein